MRHFVWRVSYRALAATRQSMSTESTLLQQWGSVVYLEWRGPLRAATYLWPLYFLLSLDRLHC